MNSPAPLQSTTTEAASPGGAGAINAALITFIVGACTVIGAGAAGLF